MFAEDSKTHLEEEELLQQQKAAERVSMEEAEAQHNAQMDSWLSDVENQERFQRLEIDEIVAETQQTAKELSEVPSESTSTEEVLAEEVDSSSDLEDNSLHLEQSDGALSLELHQKEIVSDIETLEIVELEDLEDLEELNELEDSETLDSLEVWEELQTLQEPVLDSLELEQLEQLWEDNLEQQAELEELVLEDAQWLEEELQVLEQEEDFEAETEQLVLEQEVVQDLCAFEFELAIAEAELCLQFRDFEALDDVAFREAIATAPLHEAQEWEEANRHFEEDLNPSPIDIEDQTSAVKPDSQLDLEDAVSLSPIDIPHTSDLSLDPTTCVLELPVSDLSSSQAEGFSSNILNKQVELLMAFRSIFPHLTPSSCPSTLLPDILPLLHSHTQDKVRPLDISFNGLYIPTPPLYDFQQDLAQQAEWTLEQEVLMTRYDPLYRLKLFKLSQNLSYYLFAARQGELPQLLSTHHQKNSKEGGKNLILSISYGKSNNNSLSGQSNSNGEFSKLNNSDVLTTKDGIWYHLAQHLPLLRDSHESQIFDFLASSKVDQGAIAGAIIDRDRTKTLRLIKEQSEAKYINLDMDIPNFIILVLFQYLVIKPEINPEGKTQAIITNTIKTNSSITSIILGENAQGNLVIDSIRTKRIFTRPVSKLFDERLFSNYNLWRRSHFQPKSAPLPTEKIRNLVFQTKICTESMDLSTIINQRENFFLQSKEVLRRGKQLLKEKDYWIQVKSLIKYKSGTSNQIKAGKTVFLLSKETINQLKQDMINERDIEKIFHHEGVVEKILSFIGNYKKDDLLITRTQVRTGNLENLPVNIWLDEAKFGKTDSFTHRKPDIVCITVRQVEKKYLLGIVIIDIKANERKFDPDRDGRGIGQPLRDLKFFIHELHSRTKVKLSDMEATCIVTTAKLEDNQLEIIIEKQISQEPVSAVLPFAGRICQHKGQVYRIVNAINQRLLLTSRIDLQDIESQVQDLH